MARFFRNKKAGNSAKIQVDLFGRNRSKLVSTIGNRFGERRNNKRRFRARRLSRNPKKNETTEYANDRLRPAFTGWMERNRLAAAAEGFADKLDWAFERSDC